jgi:hypothetical protein
MKILYISNYQAIAQCSGGFINDYLNDLTFYGLYEMWRAGQITELVDSTPIISLYKSQQCKIPKQNLWGGMTAFWLIEQDEVDRTNLTAKIASRYFDIIIYGAARRCLDYYELVNSTYNVNKIILLDGNDDPALHSLHWRHPYFKRELYEKNDRVFPISFSYPTPKLGMRNTHKLQDFGANIPGDITTYKFHNEQDYYQDYNQSFYGVTTKKAGWDCLRHYEILGNYCAPYFLNLENCPETCLTTLPRLLIKELLNLTTQSSFNDTQYFKLMDDAFDYFKMNCLTKHTAQYILNKTS